MNFRWNDWNREHVAKHGCTPAEAESVVRKGYRRSVKIGRGKLLVVGRGTGDRFVQVVYVLDPDRTAFVIHAMPLTTRRRRG